MAISDTLQGVNFHFAINPYLLILLSFVFCPVFLCNLCNLWFRIPEFPIKTLGNDRRLLVIFELFFHPLHGTAQAGFEIDIRMVTKSCPD